MPIESTKMTTVPSTVTSAATDPQDKKTKAAAQQFEAYFLNTMLKEMRKTVPKDTLLPDSGGQEEIFRDMMDQKLSENMSQRGDFGLANMIYQQLTKKTVDPSDPTISTSTVAVPAVPKEDVDFHR
jgi:flagellar protein FlgJ